MNKFCMSICSIGLLFSALSPAFSAKMEGFNVGGTLGVTNLTTNYNNQYGYSGVDNAFPTLPVAITTPYSNSGSAPLFTPGILFGYQKIFADHYFLGGEVALKFNRGRTMNTDQTIDAFSFSPVSLQSSDFQTTASMNYNLDLTVKPGMFIADSLLGYLKGGATYAHLNTDMLMTHNNNLVSATFRATNGDSNQSVWGFIFGAGLEKDIKNGFSIFGEYGFSKYREANLRTAVLTESGLTGLFSTITSVGTYVRNMTPYSNRFEVGIRYYFNNKETLTK